MSKLTKDEKRLLKYIKKQLIKGTEEEKIAQAIIKMGGNKEALSKLLEIAKRKPTNPFSRALKEKKEQQEAPEEIKKEIKKEPETLTEKVDDLTEKIDKLMTVKDKKKKDKSFDLPLLQRMQLKRLAKTSKLLVIYPTVNRGIKTFISQVKDEWAVIDGKPRKINLDHVFLWQGKFPCIILPEWDLEPFGTSDYYDAELMGRRSSPAATIIRMMAQKEQLNKLNMNPKTIIAFAIGAVIILAVIFGNFGG